MALNIGTAIAYLEMDTGNFTTPLKSAWDDLKRFADSSETVQGRLEGLSGAAGKAGSALTSSVTVPLAAAGAAAVKVGMDFDAQMSKVQAISGATSGEFEQLRAKAIQMGNDTKFSAYESAQAFEYMAMAGWKTGDMLDGIEGIMNLAAASGEDLALTSDIVTDALTAFGLKANDAGHFADILAAASSNSNTNVAMMGETFKYVAPLFGAMEYSAEDAALAIGLMANSGIKASQAGTSLRGIIQRMAKPTKESGFAMEMLGISITDANGEMKPFREVLENIRESMGNVKMTSVEFYEQIAALDRQLEAGEITQKEYNKQIEALTEREYGAEAALKAKYAAMLAGTTGLSGYLALVNATDEDIEKLTAAIDGSSNVFDGQGEAARQAAVMNDNFKGSVVLLLSALTTMAITISDRVTPYIQGLTEWIKGLVEWFNALSPAQQDQIVKWGLIIAAIGPVLLIFSKIVGMVASIIGIIQGVGGLIASLASAGAAFSSIGAIIGAIASPVGLAVLAIGAIAAAVIYFWNTCEGFRDFFIGAWENIKNFFFGTTDEMKTKMDTHTKSIQDSNNDIIESTNNMEEETNRAMKTHINNTDMWSDHIVDKSLETGESFYTNTTEPVSQMPEEMLGYENKMLSDVEKWSEDMISAGEKTGEATQEGVVNKISEVPDDVKETMGETARSIVETEDIMKKAGIGVMTALQTGMVLRKKEVLDVFRSLMNEVNNLVSNMSNRLESVISKTENARRTARTVNGSHASGLDYVPFNGYVAELHEGERVLTKQENEIYSGSRSGGGDTFIFNGDVLNPYENARQVKRAKELARTAIG